MFSFFSFHRFARQLGDIFEVITKGAQLTP
jgi:hypothetical protein